MLSRRRVLFHSFALRGRLEPSATKVCRQGGALEDNQVFSSLVFLGFHIKKEKKEEGNFFSSLFISRKKERKKDVRVTQVVDTVVIRRCIATIIIVLKYYVLSIYIYILSKRWGTIFVDVWSSAVCWSIFISPPPSSRFRTLPRNRRTGLLFRSSHLSSLRFVRTRLRVSAALEVFSSARTTTISSPRARLFQSTRCRRRRRRFQSRLPSLPLVRVYLAARFCVAVSSVLVVGVLAAPCSASATTARRTRPS